METPPRHQVTECRLKICCHKVGTLQKTHSNISDKKKAVGVVIQTALQNKKFELEKKVKTFFLLQGLQCCVSTAKDTTEILCITLHRLHYCCRLNYLQFMCLAVTKTSRQTYHLLLLQTYRSRRGGEPFLPLVGLRRRGRWSFHKGAF